MVCVGRGNVDGERTLEGGGALSLQMRASKDVEEALRRDITVLYG